MGVPERFEVAALLGCSVGMVKSQTSRAPAKSRLDETITREGAGR